VTNKIKFIIAAMIIAGSGLIITVNVNGNQDKKENESKIKWHSLKDGMNLMGEKKKPALLFFYTQWCTYCSKMDNEVFSDPDVISYLNSHFINIRVNPEKETEKVIIMKEKITPMELLSYSGGRGFPTTLFWDRNNKPVTSVPGFIEKEVFLSLLKYMDGQCYEKNVKFSDYRNNVSSCSVKN